MNRFTGLSLSRFRAALLAAPLALGLLFAAPDARATATFDASAFATLTITSVTNLTTPGDLGGLLIEGGATGPDCACGDPLILEGNATGSWSASVSPESGPPDFDFFVLGAGDSITMSLSGDGTADATGYADLLLLASGVLFLTNDTGSQTYSVELELDYALTSSASIDDPATEDAFGYSEIFAGTFFGPDFFEDFSEADTLFGSFTGPASDTLTFTLILGPGEFEGFGVDLAAEGLAEAISAPGALAILLAGIAILGRRRR